VSEALSTDTIAAVASPHGGAERGIVRVSGPRAFAALSSVVRGIEDAPGFRRREGVLALAGWPEAAVSVWTFRAPRSYTGEDAVELHAPGSPPLLQAILRALEAAGARLAAPGEFTRRAFLSGRIDLAQAEAIGALARAEADGEARAGARALLFGLGPAIDGTKSRILDALAHVEATIDFPEEDLPGLAPASAIATRLEAALGELEALEGRSLVPRVARPEPVVVLAGAANAGKSTLLNALAGREEALVSPHAGTTRDPVSALVALAPGVQARLVDTAGEKDAESPIEEAALGRSRELARSADLVLWLVDLAAESPASPPEGALVVGTKTDLVAKGAGGPEATLPHAAKASSLRVSARTGAGLPELRARIAKHLERSELSSDLVQTERQAGLVRRARERLAAAALLLRSSEPARLELSALDLRAALSALGELTGAVATDDLLDRIFGEFCIGK
jgi:tRNA modification GTPase